MLIKVSIGRNDFRLLCPHIQPQVCYSHPDKEFSGVGKKSPRVTQSRKEGVITRQGTGPVILISRKNAEQVILEQMRRTVQPHGHRQLRASWVHTKHAHTCMHTDPCMHRHGHMFLNPRVPRVSIEASYLCFQHLLCLHH